MKIAHVGPPLAWRGGPAGYLLQLSTAAERHGARSGHTVIFPRVETPAVARPASFGDRVRARLRPLKRALTGPPDFYRPSAEDLRRMGGPVDGLLTASMQSVCAQAAESIDAALTSDADVLFAHEPAAAERLLDVRRPGQQVWLMAHSPMPIGLDLAWSWGVPEWEWQSVAALPDVEHWIRWEIGVCSAVDRLITPCAEAVGELARVDRRFAQLPFDYVLTGAEGRERRYPADARRELRARWQLPADEPVGLFLSNALPYRGLDVLLDGVAALPDEVPGVLAIAGSSRSGLRSHPRVRQLGHVRDVSDLLHAVDFVMNVNRFSLFDLSTIEAAEAGLPMLLNATGGNVRFHALGAGCVMIDRLDRSTVAGGLEEMFTMSSDRRRALGEASRRCYDEHLTLAHFWNGHAAAYGEKRAVTS